MDISLDRNAKKEKEGGKVDGNLYYHAGFRGQAGFVAYSAT
jgi:hypothetical protein